MKSDIVSIIVPVYNGEKYISRCLDSLINQTYSNLEIVLVNDGSIDKSKEILNEYAKTDNRIKIYDQINQGASVARNIGLEKANGKYIMFVDADDYIDSHMVEEMIKNIKHENTIVFCDNTEIWSKNIDERKLFNEQLEKELKVLQKKIVNQKAKQDDRVTKTIQEYQEKKAYYENHPLVVNYLYLQNEVNEILQTINQQMNNALK